MGLDMYLTGRKFFWSVYPDRSRDRTEDGKKVTSIDVELGYWRKHPNLHGYMVQAFANGNDDCKEIELSANDLRAVIAAVETNALPTTSGFFFGESDGSETLNDLRVLRDALAWLEAGDASPVELTEPMAIGGAFTAVEVKPKPVVKPQQNVTRSVHYRGDW